jgi:hypothetical protein
MSGLEDETEGAKVDTESSRVRLVTTGVARVGAPDVEPSPSSLATTLVNLDDADPQPARLPRTLGAPALRRGNVRRAKIGRPHDVTHDRMPEGQLRADPGQRMEAAAWKRQYVCHAKCGEMDDYGGSVVRGARLAWTVQDHEKNDDLVRLRPQDRRRIVYRVKDGRGGGGRYGTCRSCLVGRCVCVEA